MEANIVRPFVTRALGTFYKLGSSDMIQETENTSNRQPQATNRGPRVSYLVCFMFSNFSTFDSDWYLVILLIAHTLLLGEQIQLF